MSETISESRLKTILQCLVDADGIVTIQDIAEKTDSSRRTIMRDLPAAEDWLRKKGFGLIRKPGSGVMLVEGNGERARLSETLSEQEAGIVNIPRDRQKLLLVELLREKNPVKLFSYTKRLGVSASTISNDLDKVGDWLQGYDLELVRKTGLGVVIRGDEANFRRAMIALLYENLSEDELLRLIKDTVPMRRESTVGRNVRNRLLNLIDRQSIETIEDIVSRMEKRLSYKLADSAAIGLMVHLALALQRLKNDDQIRIDPILLAELQREPEFGEAWTVVRELSEQFALDMPVDEVGYITMHLKGARVYLDTTRLSSGAADGRTAASAVNGTAPAADEARDEAGSGTSAATASIPDMVDAMIRIVEEESGLSLQSDPKLREDLIAHLEPALRRLSFSLDIRNPLLDKLKQLFPEVYDYSRKAAAVLAESLSRDIPESEVGYLTMHFTAAAEKNRLTPKRIRRIAVACPSGFGSSRLLSVRISKEFPELEIIDVVSIQDLTAQWLVENRVDHVVSTIPLETCAVGCLHVNPLLPQEDREKLAALLRAGSATGGGRDLTVRRDFMEDVRIVAAYSRVLLELMGDALVTTWNHREPGARAKLVEGLFPPGTPAETLQALDRQIGEPGPFPLRMAAIGVPGRSGCGLRVFLPSDPRNNAPFKRKVLTTVKQAEPAPDETPIVVVLFPPELREAALDLAADLESYFVKSETTPVWNDPDWLQEQCRKAWMDRMPGHIGKEG